MRVRRAWRFDNRGLQGTSVSSRWLRRPSRIPALVLAVALVAGLLGAYAPTQEVLAATPATSAATPSQLSPASPGASRVDSGPLAVSGSEGYRAVAADGGVFDFGTNRYLGSLPAIGVTPAAPVVGIASTPDGLGYWLVGADGGVFAFGDAGFYGSLPSESVRSAAPVVGIASTPDGLGYWLVGADGGVFAFGDAAFYGSLPSKSMKPAAPIIGIAAAFTGTGSSGQAPGYWLVGADGGVFAFGKVGFYGSLPGSGIHGVVASGITPTVDNAGYWIGTSDGSTYSFGDAPSLGDFHTQAAAEGDPARTLNAPWRQLTTVAPPGAGTAVGVSGPAVTLSLASGTTPSETVGATATLDVTVTVSGQPEAGAPVTLHISGANPATLTATTTAAGVAVFTYVGHQAGADTLVASSGSGSSNVVSIDWSTEAAPPASSGPPVLVSSAVTSQVTGNFFPEPPGTTSFVAEPGDTPAFSQNFPDVAFNPPQGLLPIPLGAPDPSTVPFTDVVTDAGGAYAGVIPAQGNGFQAGAATTAGDMTNFDAVFDGQITVSQAGYLTLGVISADGYILGVGGGASQYAGQVTGLSAGSTTPFSGYPVMAADDSCLPQAVDGSSPQPSDFPVTIRLPGPGSYPYEVDYFSCDTQSGGSPLRSLVLRTESLSPTAPTAPTVYVGYADDLRLPNNEFHYFPYPWGGSPGVAFDSPCGTSCSWDGGAVRIDNTTDEPIVVSDLVYDVPPANPYQSAFTPGGTSITIPVGSTLVIADNQDTSDFNGVGNCTPDGYIPTISMDIDGTTETYTDSTQVLNTGGFDVGVCEPIYKNNESAQWTRVGGPGTGADVPLAPAASLTLSPISASGGGPLVDEVGAAQALTVAATGADGKPIGGLPVTLVAVGANPQRLQATTDTSGVAQFSYTGTAAGDDTLAASADYQGLQVASGDTTVTWQIPVPGGASSGGTPKQAPPAISSASPADGTSITGPTPVAATIQAPAGDTITSWSVQLAQTGSGGTGTPITIASGSGSPPAAPTPLGTIDPTQLVDGTYQLSITAASSGGGVNTSTSEVIVAGTYKPGEYQAVYQDLSYPVPGFTVGVDRVYDSIDKAVGDFGVGWRLQLSDWTVGASGPLGAGGWTASATSCNLFGCQYQFDTSKAHTVTLTGPSGQQEVFDFTPSGGSGPLYFLAGNPGAFSPAPGTPTTGTLTVYEDPGLYYGFDGNLYNAALAGSGIYNPTEFVYTETNGTELLVSETSGLLDELLPNGDCVDFSSNGVVSYTGVTPANISGCAGGTEGRALSIARDGLGRVTSITEPSGQTFTYTYGTRGNLDTVTPPAPSAVDSYTYDDNHDMLTQTGPGTPLTSLTYDSDGRLVKVTDAAGNTTTITNNVSGHQVLVADPNGQLTTLYTYDGSGNLIEETRTVGGESLTDTWTYDSLGNVTSHTDPAGVTTTATYDAASNLTGFTDGSGAKTTLTYNSLGEVTSETDPTGQVIYQATYNPAGEMLSSNDVNGTTSYTYNPAGEVATVTDPDGRVTSYGYDSAGDNTSVTAPGGATTQMTYNSSGEVTSTTDPTGATTSYTYDSDGRVLTVTDGDGHVTTTDSYNANGELASETDGQGDVTTLTYTPTGQPATVTRPGGTTATYSYNADGQLTGVDVPDGSGPSYTYNGFGQLTGADNTAADISLSYTAAGNTASQVTQFNGTSQPAVTLNYGYDASGNRTSLVDPAGTTTYAYNADNELTSIVDPSGGAFGFTYNQGGSLVGLDRPNGVNDSMTYDPSIDLVSKTSTLGASTVYSSAYTYNEAGLVATMTDPAGESSYTYNADNQLTGATQPAIGPGTQSYTYDGAGNQLTSPAATSQTYNSNDELVSSSAASYTYNTLGEETSQTPTGGATTTYKWNDMGELTSVTTPAGTTSYAYDALGRRVEVDAEGQVTRYVDDGTNPVLSYDAAGALDASWVDGLGSGTPLEESAGGQRYYYLTDGENSTTALTDSAGKTVDSYTYGAYGATTVQGAAPNPFAYTGQAYDPSDGLYYMNARYYDPSTGRFLSEDPVPNADPYPYVGSDPTNFVDPTGAEAMVETAYTTLLSDQIDIAQQIQKINACLAGQLLYIVLAMRGYAVTPPSLGQVAAQYLLGQANDAAQSEITNARNYLLDQIGMGWAGSAWDQASPYAESPSQWATTARSNAQSYATSAAGYLLGKVGLPSSLAGLASGQYSEAQSLATAAQLASSGNPTAAENAICDLCRGG